MNGVRVDVRAIPHPQDVKDFLQNIFPTLFFVLQHDFYLSFFD